MARPRLAWRVFALVAAASTVLVAVMALAGMATMRRLNEDAGSFTLSRGAAALAALAPTEESAARSFCASGGADSGLRLTIVGPDGRVWGDSRSDPATMENHLDRYEVREALRGNAASSTRVSGTLGLSMTYAAAPIQRDGTTVAALRVAMDTPELAGRVKPFVSSSLAAAALLLLFGAGAGAWIGKTLAKPLDALARTASRWSEGRLECRARGISDPDFSLLADTMNAMAEELSLRIKESERGKAELAAVLAALGEGVIAVDGTLTVRFSNPKARELLGAAAPLEGKGLLLATGNTELEALAADCAARKVPVSVELPV